MGRVILVRHGARTPIADEPWKVRVAQRIGDWKDNELHGELTELGKTQMHDFGHAIGDELTPKVVHIAWSPDESGRCHATALAIMDGIKHTRPRCRLAILNDNMDDDTATLLLRGHTLLPKNNSNPVVEQEQNTVKVIEKYFPDTQQCAHPVKVLKFIDTTFMTTQLHGRLNKGIKGMMKQLKKECKRVLKPELSNPTQASEPLLAFVSQMLDKPGLTILVCHDNTITNFLAAQELPVPVVPFGGYVVCTNKSK